METKPKKRNPLWDILTALCTKQYPEWKDLPEELQNGYSQFMINRFICSYDYLIPVADQLATQKLTDDMHYNILIGYVKHTKHYFKYDYFKGTQEYDQAEIDSVKKEYDLTDREAKFYLGILTKEQKSHIVNKWKDYFKFTAIPKE